MIARTTPILALLLIQATQAQQPNIQSALKATKEHLLALRIRASIKHVGAPTKALGPGYAQTGVWTSQWACAGEKRYESDPDGGITSWDGAVSRRKNPQGGSRFDFFEDSLRLPLADDPFETGYRTEFRVPGSAGESKFLWMADLVSEKGATIQRLGNGKLRLQYNSSRNQGLYRKLSYTLDPARGYMIEFVQDEASHLMNPNNVAAGTAISVAETHVLACQQIKGCWIPTRVHTNHSWSPHGKLTTKRTDGFEVTDISTEVPDSLFTDVFKPGDTVWRSGYSFKVASNGMLVPFAKEDSKTPNSWLKVIGLAVGITAVITILNRLRLRTRNS